MQVSEAALATLQECREKQFKGCSTQFQTLEVKRNLDFGAEVLIDDLNSGSNWIESTRNYVNINSKVRLAFGCSREKSLSS